MARTEHRSKARLGGPVDALLGHRRWLAAALLGLAGGACRDAAAPPERAPSALPSASAPVVNEAACREGAATCIDASKKTTCTAGALVEATCGAESSCLGGACVALTDVDGTPVPRSRVRTLGADGALNAWSAVTPVAKKSVDAFTSSLDFAQLGAPKAWKPICARDGYVVPRAKGVDKDVGQVASVLSGIVFSDQARTVRLWASVSGKLHVFLGSRQVLDITEARNIQKRPMRDERSASVELPKGPSYLSVVLEAPADAERWGGFFAGLRAADGARLSGVAFSERFDGCDDDALLELGASIAVAPAGLTLSLAPRFTGLVPADANPFPLRVAVSVNGRETSSSDAAASGPVVIPPVERGAFDVSIRRKTRDASDGPLFKRTFPAYGALIGRVAKLAASVRGAAEKSSVSASSKDSFEHHVSTLETLIGNGDTDIAFLERQTKTAERLAERLDRGEDPYAAETGIVYRAYRSALDGKLQPYVAFVPKSQLKHEPQPLVIIAHGRDRLPEHALRTLIGQAPDDHMTLRFAERNLPGFPDQGALLVAPYGYDEGGPHPLGEDDVLRVVSEMSSAYAVDARRVSITGYSLGGTVAFVVPLLHPDVFSAAAPLCGYPNLMAYSSVAGVAHSPWEDTLLARKYVVNYAENGAYLPLQIVHGGLDGPGRSKVVADKYKELGYPYIFDVQDDLDHDVWDYAYEDSKMVPWLAGKKRPASPKRVRFAGDYRDDHAYWVKLDAMGDAALPLSRIDARLDEAQKAILVKTENVRAFTIDRSALEPRTTWTAAGAITVDGTKLDIAAGDAPLHLEHAGSWALAAEAAPSKGHKRHGVSGPLDDVLRHPITVVYGTGNEAHTAANHMVAESIAQGVGLADLDYPLLSDVEATPQAIAKTSLILVGNPSENAVVARFAASLPVKFEAGAIVVQGKRYEGESTGVSFIAPRPDDPDEYVVVHAGLGERAVLASRFLPRYLPDFVVYDDRITSERGGLLFGDRPVIAGGFFGDGWE